MISSEFIQPLLQSIELASNVTLFVLLFLSIKLSFKVGLKLNRIKEVAIDFWLFAYLCLGILEVFFEPIRFFFVIFDLFSFLGVFIAGTKMIKEFKKSHPDINPMENYLKIFLIYLIWVVIIIQLLHLTLTSSVMTIIVGIKYLLIGYSANFIRVIALRTQYRIMSYSLTASVLLYFGVAFASFLPYISPGYFLLIYGIYMITVYTSHLNLLLPILAILSTTWKESKKF